MPLLKFQNYTAASRKRNMIAFHMFRHEASPDMDVIEDVGSGTLGVTDTGDHQTFTLSASPVASNTIVVRNGLIQRYGASYDYTLSGSTLLLTTPLDINAPADFVQVYTIGGE